MSKKGCSPDDSAMEGFFGRLKNEFFHHRDWSGVTIPEFCRMLDAYLRYYNEERPKEKLGWLSPMQYRRSLGWPHSRSKEMSTYPYLFSEETGSALSRGGIWARSLRPLATMGSHLTAGSGWNRASRFAFRMPCRRAASRT